jgi:hypothetical protein
VCTGYRWSCNVKFSDVPIYEGVMDITCLHLVAGLNDVCCGVY